jgi:hypothetical protein
MLLSRRLWFADAGSSSAESRGKLNGKLLKSSDSSSEMNQSTCKYKSIKSLMIHIIKICYEKFKKKHGTCKKIKAVNKINGYSTNFKNPISDF